MGRTKKTVIEKAVKAPKLTFVDRVISASKAENPDNLEKFQERAIRYADREIQAIEDKLIDAKTAIKDSKDVVTEASLKVNLESITSVATSLDHVDTSSSDEETTTINGEEGLIHEFSPDSLTPPSPTRIHEDKDSEQLIIIKTKEEVQASHLFAEVVRQNEKMGVKKTKMNSQKKDEYVEIL